MVLLWKAPITITRLHNFEKQALDNLSGIKKKIIPEPLCSRALKNLGFDFLSGLDIYRTDIYGKGDVNPILGAAESGYG